MQYEELIAQLRPALLKHKPRLLPDKQDTPAAVLLPLLSLPSQEAGVLFIKRVASPGPHSGQVACPGGRAEPGENSSETAWREAREEVGLLQAHAQLLGQLDDARTLAGYVVSAFVAAVDETHPPWRPDPREIEEIFVIPWQVLADENSWSTLSWGVQGSELSFPCLHWEQKTLWGLTARFIKQLIALLDSSPAQAPETTDA